MTHFGLLFLCKGVVFLVLMPVFLSLFLIQGPIGAAAGAAHDAQIDWGHLKADVVQYGGGDQRYDILAADDSDAGAGQMPPLPREPPPAGTGANTAPLPPR